MTDTRHNQIRSGLDADPEHGVPEGRMAITLSTRNGRHSISAGWIRVGAKTTPAARTVVLLDGDLNVGLGKNEEFLGLEMLRRPTGKECKAYFDWSHREPEFAKTLPEGHWHVPCLAFETLYETWKRYESIIKSLNDYRLAPPEEQYARAIFDLAVAAGVDPKEWIEDKRLENVPCP